MTLNGTMQRERVWMKRKWNGSAASGYTWAQGPGQSHVLKASVSSAGVY